MRNIHKEQLAIVQNLTAEIQSAENHFLLKQAIKPLKLVLKFMRTVVAHQIESDRRLMALEEKAGVSHDK